MFEDKEEVVGGSRTMLVEEGRLDRMSETLFRKKVIKVSARVEGSSCEGKERLLLLRSKSLLKVLKSCCWLVLARSVTRAE